MYFVLKIDNICSSKYHVIREIQIQNALIFNAKLLQNSCEDTSLMLPQVTKCISFHLELLFDLVQPTQIIFLTDAIIKLEVKMDIFNQSLYNMHILHHWLRIYSTLQCLKVGEKTSSKRSSFFQISQHTLFSFDVYYKGAL